MNSTTSLFKPAPFFRGDAGFHPFDHLRLLWASSSPSEPASGSGRCALRAARTAASQQQITCVSAELSGSFSRMEPWFWSAKRPKRRSEARHSPRMAAEPESCWEVVEVSRLQLQGCPSHRHRTGRRVFTPGCHFKVKVCPLLPDRQTPGTLKAKVLESLKRKGKVKGEKKSI